MDRVSTLSKQTFHPHSLEQSSTFHSHEHLNLYNTYNQLVSFASGDQTTISSQWTNASDMFDQDYTKQTTTARESQITTPNSIFSGAVPARNGSQEVETPASSLSGMEQYFQVQEYLPAQRTMRAQVQSSLTPGQTENRLFKTLDSVDDNGRPWPDEQLFTSVRHLKDETARDGNRLIDFLNNPDACNGGLTEDFYQFLPVSTQTNTEAFSTTSVGKYGAFLGQQEDVFSQAFDDLEQATYDPRQVVPVQSVHRAYPSQQYRTQHSPQLQAPFDFNQPLSLHDYLTTSDPTLPTLSSRTCSAGYSPNDSGVGTPNPGRGRKSTKNHERDQILVNLRRQGVSYKDIMAKYDWGLEESTLRGRYRTLTKKKEERLRKPVWNERAEQALVDGIEAEAPPSAKKAMTKEAIDKVPWKKVAQWMVDNRGCYHYGNATVKKKYRSLVAREQQKLSKASDLR